MSAGKVRERVQVPRISEAPTTHTYLVNFVPKHPTCWWQF